jgi:hypothetical protein
VQGIPQLLTSQSDVDETRLDRAASAVVRVADAKRLCQGNAKLQARHRKTKCKTKVKQSMRSD